jgi:hypothetical protein
VFFYVFTVEYMTERERSEKIVLRFKARIAGRRQRLFIEVPKALREMAQPLVSKELLVEIREAE